MSNLITKPGSTFTLEKFYQHADAFKKKPVTIRAMQLTESLKVSTLEGVMYAAEGDWLIEGIGGELYPCKPHIFAKTYEKVIDEQ